MSNENILNEENEVLKARVEALEKLNKELAEQNRELLDESKKKDQLLAFLPSQAAKELKINKGRSLRYQMVTVLFSDVKGFTKLSGQDDAEELVDKLDRYFFQFDETVKKYNIEKIKSIGDTYIAAGGIPRKNRTNPIEVVLAALDMLKYLQELQHDSEKSNQRIWDITIGIHTGPVVASVTGKKKVSYEIKGDTVNIASRIESSSEIALVNISDMTYEFVKEYFVCEYKAKLPVKYKGDTALYVVKGLRPDLSVDGMGLEPNQKFRTKFQMIKFEDLEELILDRLERELPKHLYYHNLKHTIDVTIGVEIIGAGEGVDEEEMLLLKTAALFHDTGQIYGSRGHEERSCEIMMEYLPKFGYSEEQLSIMKGIIMATQLPPTPKTKLERIICDADLDYLGRRDFVPVSDLLFDELKVQGLVGSQNDWNKLQVKFLGMHQFFTETALKMRLVNKELQIDRINSLIE